MTVYLSHATSFCGAVWDPVRTALHSETLVWDHPGHGAGPEAALPIDWKLFGEHVLDVTQTGGIGVGHSMGAAALVMAQIADPRRFRALVLVEPIIYPPPFERQDNEMSTRAARRRQDFPSREAAAESFRGRGAFVGWDEAAFEGYLRCGLVGDGPVRLACAPEVEADIYRASRAHDTWEHLGEVEIPILVMSGAESDTISPEFARAQAGRFPRAGVEIVPDSGHFLPMERPDIVAERVGRLVDTLV